MFQEHQLRPGTLQRLTIHNMEQQSVELHRQAEYR